jgi:hypothetical protein
VDDALRDVDPDQQMRGGVPGRPLAEIGAGVQDQVNVADDVHPVPIVR